MIPPQPWPMEVIVGMVLVLTFGLVIWLVIGAVVVVTGWRRRRSERF